MNYLFVMTPFAIAKLNTPPKPSILPSPITKWDVKSATFTKEKMKRHIGAYPSWLESNCEYAIASINDYPVILFPFREFKAASPIALSYYANSKALEAYGMKRKIWNEYEKQVGPLPKIPLKFKTMINK